MHSAAPYLYSDDIFFKARPAPTTAPYRCSVPAEWRIAAGTEWTEYEPAWHETPTQGWKIHISAEQQHASEVLRRAALVAVRHQVVFKHLTDRLRFLSRNSKLCARAHAGKFITLYPVDQNLEEILTDLEASLSDFTGPYVLSDRRWQSGPIFLRYGAFRPISGPDGPFYGMLSTSGNYVTDERSLQFSVPRFASRPAALRDWLQKLETPDQVEALPFTAHQALKFSNAGGTYRATYQGNPVVVKEGRPCAGLDLLGRDAVTRLNHEHAVLNGLAGVPGIPSLRAHFTLWENTFLIEDEAPGQPLHHWASDRAIFRSTNQDEAEARLTEQATVLDALEAIIDEIHQHGWAHLDLHAGNVLIDPTSTSVSLIDFENAARLDEGPCSQPMAAAGYGLSGTHDPKVFDIQGLRQIALFLLWPGIGDALLDPHRADHVTETLRGRSHYLGLPTNHPQMNAALEHLERLSEHVHTLLRSQHDITRSDGPARHRTVDSSPARSGLTWEAAFRAGVSACRQLHTGTQEPVHHHALSRRWGGLGYGTTLFTQLSGANSLSPSLNDAEHLGLFTGFVGDLLCSTHPLGGMPTQAEFHQLLGASGPRVFDGLPGILLGLATIPELANDTDKWAALSQRAATLAGAYLARPEDYAPVTTAPRTDSPDAHNSGLLYGHLGIAWALSRFLDTGPAIIAEACTHALRAELGCYIRADNGRALVLSQGTRTIPYLALGSAGFGIALPGIPPQLWPSELRDQLDALEAACDIDGCVFPGLFNGIAGLQLGRAGLRTVAGTSSPNQKPQRVLNDALELFAFGLDDTAVVHGDGAGRITCDLATGGAGIALALYGLRTRTYDLLHLVRSFLALDEIRDYASSVKRAHTP